MEGSRLRMFLVIIPILLENCQKCVNIDSIILYLVSQQVSTMV